MPKWLTILMGLALLGPGTIFGADDDKYVKGQVSRAQEQIANMQQIHARLEKGAQDAKAKSDVERLNCMIIKVNLIKGLVKASQRARGVLETSVASGDVQIANVYGLKIDSYFKSANLLEKSVRECISPTEEAEGTTLVYLRPEEEDGLRLLDIDPWDWNHQMGSEGYPIVPAASPFR